MPFGHSLPTVTPSPQSLATVTRYHSLDFLRGLAALCVVFWHWQHFFFFGPDAGKFNSDRQPFYSWASLMYTKGWLAVDLFFCLSGFIFFWLYAQRIFEKRISASKFAWLRFSRLYPLHFATLIIATVGQFLFIHWTGNSFIYPEHDAWHFLLNLTLTASWGLERGAAFNGPIWSISVEVLLYGLFFAVCRVLRVRLGVLFLIAAAGLLLVYRLYPPVGRGIGSFFLGGCVFMLQQMVIHSSRGAAWRRWIYSAATAAWLLTFAVHLHGLGRSLPPGVDTVATYLASGMQSITPRLFLIWPIIGLFPLTILALALLENSLGRFFRRFSMLGDISYSVYLLHFPLQLIVMAVAFKHDIQPSIFYSPWMMTSFMTVLLCISGLSFKYFEMPMQSLLRRALTFKNRPDQSPTVNRPNF